MPTIHNSVFTITTYIFRIFLRFSWNQIHESKSSVELKLDMDTEIKITISMFADDGKLFFSGGVVAVV